MTAQRRVGRRVLGAQVWFAPDEYDTDAEIDAVFDTMARHQMLLARVSLNWNYVNPSPGVWDFDLFDRVFASAHRHGVQITATIWPQGKSATLGNVPDTSDRWRMGEEYLARVIEHFRHAPALESWVVMNEPGQPPAETPFARQRFRAWLSDRYGTIDELNTAWIQRSALTPHAPFASFDEIEFREADFDPVVWLVPLMDWQEFWRDHLAWYMGWVAAQVRRIDPDHSLHANPHGVIANLAGHSFDFPQWREFLDSLGVSIYPLHMRAFGAQRHTLAFSYVIELLQGAMGTKPVWVTELVGGHVHFSHDSAYSPDPIQLAQWLWVSYASGAERVVMWMLNGRWKAREAGEFSLLDYLRRPTDRLRAISDVITCINEDLDGLEGSEPMVANVTLLVSPETMSQQWIREKSDGAPGRGKDAHLLSLLGVFEALAALGVAPAIAHADDFGWEDSRAEPHLLIVPHVTVMSSELLSRLQSFVQLGNHVVIEGHSGFYDRTGMFWPMEKVFPLEALVGARPIEIELPAHDIELLLGDGAPLSMHMWETKLEITTGATIASVEGRPAGTQQGTVVWLPQLLGLASFQGSPQRLAEALAPLVEPFRTDPFRLTSTPGAIVLRTLRLRDGYLTVVANQTSEAQVVRLEAPTGFIGESVAASAEFDSQGDCELSAHSTVVTRWRLP